MNKQCLFALAILLLVACCCPQSLLAQTAPTRRSYKIKHQELLPNGSGNHAPVRVQITRVPAVPLAKDQHFHAMVHNNWNPDSTEAWSTGMELTIPAGQTSAEVELIFSCDSSNDCMLLVEQSKTHSRGVGDDLYHESIPIGQANRSRGWLLISSNTPKEPCAQTHTVSLSQAYNRMGMSRNSIGQFNEAFEGSKQIPGLKKIFGTKLTRVLNREDWHALQPSELPQTWVGLSSVGRILISNDEFKSLVQVPAYRKLLKQWVAAGGYLFIFNPGNSLKHADSVFPLLRGKEQTNSEQAKSTRRWSTLNRSNANYRSAPSKYWNTDLSKSSELTAKSIMASSTYLNGRVVVMVAPEKLPNLSESRFPYPDAIANKYANMNRNARYAAIPGVGKPPIALFGVFTALFLFLIGPVILVVVTLNNDRRFLFFLVPIFSFLTCSSILGYAIVADFNKQLGRTETISVLDSREGVAFTRASSAYYCGSQPPFYAYDTDTLIQTTTDRDSGYRIRQLPDENRLSSPRIQPRKIHEVFTAKPHQTQQRFRVTDSAKKPGTPEVTNLLGSRIQKAAFEFKGKLYLVKDVAHKQTALGIKTTPAECRKELRDTISLKRSGGGSAFFNSSGSRINSAASRISINRTVHREFFAIIDSNPATESLTEPFNYKLQLNVVHGKHN